MNLDFLPGNLDGDSWEKLCDACYRDRYKSENYVKIPATHSGDTGIEGFTHSGIVYQCYCPSKNYSDQELYEHLREKVSQDIKKLIDIKNSERIKKLGIKNIKEWHFVIPEYKDKRIVEHLESKRKKIVDAVEKHPIELSYIDEKIVLVIKTAYDFTEELARCIINPLHDISLNLAVKKTGVVDWSLCEADKVNNIKRKVKALLPETASEQDFEQMVNIFAESYVHGIEIMRKLRETYSVVYENIFELEQQYKTTVSVKSMLNPDKSLNNQLFNDILEDFESKLKENVPGLSPTSIMEFRMDLVCGWIADCSLNFKEK